MISREPMQEPVARGRVDADGTSLFFATKHPGPGFTQTDLSGNLIAQQATTKPSVEELIHPVDNDLALTDHGHAVSAVIGPYGEDARPGLCEVIANAPAKLPAYPALTPAPRKLSASRDAA